MLHRLRHDDEASPAASLGLPQQLSCNREQSKLGRTAMNSFGLELRASYVCLILAGLDTDRIDDMALSSSMEGGQIRKAYPGPCSSKLVDH
jgi:hypothetical protein